MEQENIKAKTVAPWVFIIETNAQVIFLNNY